jgi:hypothetical protein
MTKIRIVLLKLLRKHGLDNEVDFLGKSIHLLN